MAFFVTTHGLRGVKVTDGLSQLRYYMLAIAKPAYTHVNFMNMRYYYNIGCWCRGAHVTVMHMVMSSCALLCQRDAYA